MSRIAIVGGGLAGMACAAALSGRGLQLELFEARKKLGGRAGSYVDRATGEAIDHCQHVAMACCTNYLDFCRRTGIDDLLVRQRTLHFIAATGEQSVFTPSPWLPAPLHLIAPLLALRFLSFTEKLAIARSMLALVRAPRVDKAESPTVLTWLKSQRQSEQAIERFWKVILVSALAESLDRASLAAARKVFVDGFMAHHDAANLYVPKVALDELYHHRVRQWLLQRSATVRLETPIAAVVGGERQVRGLQMLDGQIGDFDVVVLAVPWTRVRKLLREPMLRRVDPGDHLARIQASPISSVHLWFDRSIMDLANAVLIGRLSQWVFGRTLNPSSNEFYYQVVISASHELAGRERQSIIDEVVHDIAAVFPMASQARLLRAKLITDDHAVFSMVPGLDAIRPSQQTAIPRLILAGDWTRTLWPATMEGAVRSGYLAAEAVLQQLGAPERILVPDLPRNWLTRWL